MDKLERIDAFIQGASRLPAFPTVISKLFRVIDAPGTSADDVAGVIELDSALAARLLKLANSSFYGLGGRVASVRHAVVVLGNKTIRSLALTVWTHTLKDRHRTTQDPVLASTLFSHGVMTALAARLLAMRVNRSLEEDAFLAGLLHDIGRFAISVQVGRPYSELVARCDMDRQALIEAETDEFGFDHGDLGARLLETWKLPSFLAEAARAHHRATTDLGSDPVLCATALADAFATTLGHNIAPLAPRLERPEFLAQFRMLTEEDIEDFKGECLRRYDEFLASF